MQASGSITTCCLCSEVYTDPRTLPCTHTFCLNCILTIGLETKTGPGDDMPCPLCRQLSKIPSDGFSGLPKHIFIENLIKMRNVSDSSAAKRAKRAVCLEHQHAELDKGSASDICGALSNLSVRAKESQQQGQRMTEIKFQSFYRLGKSEAEGSGQAACDEDNSFGKSEVEGSEQAACDEGNNFGKSEAEGSGQAACDEGNSFGKSEVEGSGQAACDEGNSFGKSEVEESVEATDEDGFVKSEVEESVEATDEDGFGKSEVEESVEATIEEDSYNTQDICGLTILHQEVFVIRYTRYDIEVYDSSSFHFQRRITVDGMWNPSSIVSCSVNNCLYAAVWRCILRINPIDGSLITTWETRESFNKISVASDTTVILCPNNEDNLYEYTSIGEHSRTIKLGRGRYGEKTRDIKATHAVKLDNGLFVVSQSYPSCFI